MSWFDADRAPERLALKDSVNHMLEECRMVLPGVQALFGFQLVAVFSDRFEELTRSQQVLHYASIILVAVSIVLVMSPAAFHRLHSPREVSERFVKLGSLLLVAGMAPLAVALCMDVYLVGRLLFDADWVITATMALFGVFVLFWVLLPTITPVERPRRQRESEPV